MKITAVSDLHGYYPKLPGGDLLIVAGDLTGRGSTKEYSDFAEWYLAQDYRKKVFIAGNHDTCIESGEYYFNKDWLGYLQDSGTEFEGLKIWGCPHSLHFEGINPHCMAFTGTERCLKKKYDLIPDDVDILVTHTPPFGILDRNYYNKNCGSRSLLIALENRIKPRLLICGHLHENGSKRMVFKRSGHGVENNTLCINASHVNEYYDPVNEPLTIVL